MSKELEQTVKTITESFDALRNAHDTAVKEVSPAVKAEIEKRANEVATSLETMQAEHQKLKAAFERGGLANDNAQTEQQKAEKAAYDAFLRKGDRNLNTEQQKYLSTDSLPDGGYMVPAQMLAPINGRIFETSAMRSIATVIKTSQKSVEMPLDDQEASAGWAGEGDVIVETGTPQIGKIEIAAKKMYAFPRMTEEMLADSAFDVEAATAMHLPSENVALVFKALEQMAAKGTVQMEELKGQLGESLPGAFEIAAKAMGVTTAELGELMQKGQVMSGDFLPKFAAAVRQEFGASLEDATQSAQAAFNRLENALFDLKARFASAGILDAVTDGVVELTAAVNDPQVQAGLAALAGLLAQVASAAVQAAASIGSFTAKANSAVESVGNNLPFGLGAEVQKQRVSKNDAATFQQRMIQQTIADFNAQHAPAAPKVSGSYTLGKLASPDTSAADKAAEKARKKAAREAEQARKEAEREAKRQADERDSLSGQVRDIGVSIGSDPDKLQASYEDQQKIIEEALAKQAITKEKYNEMMAATDEAYRQKLKDYVTEQFGTETEQENAQYEEKQKRLEEALELRLVTDEEYRRMAEELEQEHQDNLNEIRQDAAEKALQQQRDNDALIASSRKQALDSILGFVQVFANKNKAIAIAMLAFEKARAIAEMLINTEVAAAKALAIYGPTPMGIAAATTVRTMGYISAAAVAATGIAQAAMMASGDKSSGSPGNAGTSFNSSTGQYEQNTTGQNAVTQVYISIEGGDRALLSGLAVRQLIDQINEQQKSGARVEVYAA
ncbi:phage major capsid protein [Methylobacterium sp. Gmos1]